MTEDDKIEEDLINRAFEFIDDWKRCEFHPVTCSNLIEELVDRIILYHHRGVTVIRTY